jgi:hypothetical protein
MTCLKIIERLEPVNTPLITILIRETVFLRTARVTSRRVMALASQGSRMRQMRKRINPALDQRRATPGIISQIESPLAGQVCSNSFK